MDILTSVSLPSWKRKKREEKLQMLTKVVTLRNIGYFSGETSDEIVAFAMNGEGKGE